MRIIWATMVRQSQEIRAAFPWHFFIGRTLSGVYAALFAYFLVHYGFSGEASQRFRQASGSDDIFTFAILGTALNVMAVACLMNVGRTLMNELREGTLPALMLAPAHQHAYFLASWLQQWLRCLLEVLPTLALGAMLGANLLTAGVMDYLALTMIAMTGLFCMGILLAWVMIFTRDTYLTQNTLFALLTMICGVLCPRALLPEPLQWLAQVIPFSHILDLFRHIVLLNQSWAEQGDTLLWVAGTSVVCLLLAVVLFKGLDQTINERALA